MGIAADLRVVAAGIVNSEASGFAGDTEPSYTRKLMHDAGGNDLKVTGQHLA